MFGFAVLLSLALLVSVLAPFWLVAKEPLVEASVINDVGRLIELKEKVLRRYIQEEESFRQGNITAREWRGRQQFLSNRYVDLVSRLDYLRAKA